MFLYLTRFDGAWTVTTRDGHLLTCNEQDLREGSPRLPVHPRCSVPTMPWNASECAHCQPRPVHNVELQEAAL